MKLVQTFALQELLKRKLKRFVNRFAIPPPKPVAQIKANTTEIIMIATRNVLNLPSTAISPLLTKPQSKRPMNTITNPTERKRIRFPTTIFGKTALTKINPMIKEIKAFNCFLSEPSRFVFSNTAKTMKKINKKGYKKSVKIGF